MTSSSRAPPRHVPPPSGPASAKASPYARFIPREELNDFAAWSPGEVSGGPAPGRPPREAATAADTADKQAEAARAARQSGYQDGYRDGLVALEGFKQSFAQQTTRQVGLLLESIGSQLDGLQQEMAQALVATAASLAAQILRSELSERPGVVARVAEEALDTLLLSARHITLRVHPDDQPLVAEGAADVIAARGARLIADASVTRGGCLVESDIGSIDASLETRWRRATAALGLELALPKAELAKAVSAKAEPASREDGAA